ncbi:MAG: hypothetical protein QMC79_09795 [Anaerosomatales bacterium]|nr:hypothetical protein [Anaerosomatales bacterium]
MRRSAVVLLALLALLSAGCRDAAPETTDATPPAAGETTASAGEGAAAESGPDAPSVALHSPAEGSAERMTLLGAARDYLRIPEDLVCRQVQVEGDAAVLDVEAAPAGTGWRTFLGLSRSGEDWVVTFSTPAFDGEPDSSAEWMSQVPASLVDAVDWALPRRELASAAREHAIACGAGMGGFAPSELAATDPRMARTAVHEWWASSVVSYTGGGLDPLVVYMRWRPDGDGWETVDCGTGIEPTHDPRFPTEVADEL